MMHLIFTGAKQELDTNLLTLLGTVLCWPPSHRTSSTTTTNKRVPVFLLLFLQSSCPLRIVSDRGISVFFRQVGKRLRQTFVLKSALPPGNTSILLDTTLSRPLGIVFAPDTKVSPQQRHGVDLRDELQGLCCDLLLANGQRYALHLNQSHSHFAGRISPSRSGRSWICQADVDQLCHSQGQFLWTLLTACFRSAQDLEAPGQGSDLYG